MGQSKLPIIGISFLILIGLIFFIVNDEKHRLDAALPTTFLSPDDANRIEVTQGNTTYLLEKKSGQWRLTKPVNAAANEERVVPLLALLTEPGSTPYPLADVDLNELGLLEPEATITINTIKFILGGPGPGERQRYLQINNSVYLTRDIVLPLVAAGPEALIASDD